MFHNTNSTISEIANLSIIFSTGDYMNLDFYVTLLDSSCLLVLGYNWLAWHNPLIDWVNGLTNFCPSLQENLAPSCIVANTPLVSLSLLDIPLQLLDSAVSIPASETSVSNSEWPNIVIIGAAAFLHASKLPGFHNFELCLCSSDIQANSTKLAEAPDLSNVPSKYHEFTDVLSKSKAKVLAPYCPYDLKNQSERRCSTSSWLYILSFGIWTRGSAGIHWGKSQHRFHPTNFISAWCTSLIH